MSMYIGEALCGDGNEVAHIDLLIGDKAGPVGNAFASALATQSKGHTNLLHYDTSKGAVISFTRSIARELGDDGIRANTIAPGGIMTEAVLSQETVRTHIAKGTATRAIKREQVPEDAVGACIFLASEESDFITGQVLVVDGGSAMN